MNHKPIKYHKPHTHKKLKVILSASYFAAFYLILSHSTNSVKSLKVCEDRVNKIPFEKNLTHRF